RNRFRDGASLSLGVDWRDHRVMGPFVINSLLVTPNFRGADGISSLSRQIARALPEPLVVLSLHDGDDIQSGQMLVRGAAGSRSRLLALAVRLSAECSRDTVAICTHLH